MEDAKSEPKTDVTEVDEAGDPLPTAATSPLTPPPERGDWASHDLGATWVPVVSVDAATAPKKWGLAIRIEEEEAAPAVCPRDGCGRPTVQVDGFPFCANCGDVRPGPGAAGPAAA